MPCSALEAAPADGPLGQVTKPTRLRIAAELAEATGSSRCTLSTCLASARLLGGARKLIVRIPAEPIACCGPGRQGSRAICRFGPAIQRQIDGAANREPNEFRTLAQLHWRDSLQVPSAAVVQLNQNLSHIPEYIPSAPATTNG